MEAAKNLRRPTNWQDFETLCKKLWGEIWSCPEIKKNGRNGQAQHGVDVYGMPFGEDRYYGIQCKGKDEYTNRQFTEEEIVAEVEKAKLFQPALKKLYFATTAVKDTDIEEFVRKKNIENRANGLFEVHIFSWEDIVDLIDANRQTHDWYVKNQNFKTNKSVSATFQDGSKELTLIPRFTKNVTKYRQKIIPEVVYNHPLKAFFEQQDRFSTIIMHAPKSERKINLSYCQLYFEIHNTGIEPIEEYKMFFEFIGDVQDLKKTNEESTGIMIPLTLLTNHKSDVALSTDSMSGKILPGRPVLVGDDVYASDYIFLKPYPKEYEISVKWKLISKDLKDEGILKLIIKPIFETKYKEIIVEDPLQVKTVEDKNVEDVIIDKRE